MVDKLLDKLSMPTHRFIRKLGEGARLSMAHGDAFKHSKYFQLGQLPVSRVYLRLFDTCVDKVRDRY